MATRCQMDVVQNHPNKESVQVEESVQIDAETEEERSNEKMKKKCSQVQLLWRILNGLLTYRKQSKKDKDKKQENKRKSMVLPSEFLRRQTRSVTGTPHFSQCLFSFGV